MSGSVEWGDGVDYVSKRPAMVDAQWKQRAEKAEADNARLREALREIVTYDTANTDTPKGDLMDSEAFDAVAGIARAALRGGSG